MEDYPTRSNQEKQNFDSLLSQHNLPNANTVLILGILSIAFCWWHLFSIIGFVLSIITLSFSSKDLMLYRMNPEKYTLSSLNNIKAGRICAIIGLVISIVVFLVVLLIILGVLATMPFWGMID